MKILNYFIMVMKLKVQNIFELFLDDKKTSFQNGYKFNVRHSYFDNKNKEKFKLILNIYFMNVKN